MGSVQFKTIKGGSSMRKLALGAWSNPTDPSVNVQVDFDVTKLINHLSLYLRQLTGTHQNFFKNTAGCP